MSPPRILFVYQFLTLGGVEVVMQTRLAELARRNIEARMLFLDSYGGESLFAQMGDRIAVRTKESEIASYLADFNPDWISTIDTAAIIPIARRAAPQARIVYEVHTPYPASYAVLLDPATLEAVAGIIVPSQSQKEFIAPRLARPLEIRVVANSIPEEFFERAPSLHKHERPIVMWVGRLDSVKNWRGFVELSARLKKRADAEFWLVGGLRSSPQEQESLFEAIKQAGLFDSFRWVPAVDHKAMPSLYSFAGQSGGCTVSTSRAESFGMAALEAMASRCPMVAPDIVGLRDVVKHGRTGWLYPAMNMARACDLVLESLEDARARAAVIENGERAARSFTPKATVDQFLEALSAWSTAAAPKAAPVPSEREELFDQLKATAQWQAAQAAEKDRTIESLSRQLDEQRQTLAYLRSKLSTDEAEIESLQTHFSHDHAEQQQAIELLKAQLAHKQAELSRITNSLGWRLLSRYGRIKYRYLLPVYRMLSREQKQAVAAPAPQTEQAAAQIEEQSYAAPLLNPTRKYDVICLPIIDWHFRFQRPQQLLTQFARDGHRVFYVNTKFQQEQPKIVHEEIGGDIYGIRLPGPASLSLYVDEIDGVLLESLLRSLDEFRYRASIEDAVCLVQLPFWEPLAFALKKRWGCKIVYDCMDEHSGFSTTHKNMLKHEEALTAQSDLVLVTSRVLHKKASSRARQVLLLPNAADFDHFNKPGALRPLSSMPGPIIGYYGAISDWFDVKMVHDAAAARPEWQFVLIGDTFGANVSPLKRLSNVHLLGEQHYASLPGYLHDFDVACIPFLRNPLTEATNPVKFYEYLSAGKPVVAVELPELEPYGEYYYPVRSPEQFVPQIEAALDERSPAKVLARIELARDNTWEKRYEALESSIHQLYPKAAIIIISFKNLEYLRLCLDSIWAKTLYPNFQVIVVDNGSQPNIVEYLLETAKREPRLKVILNGTNLGFARANNVGIRAADDSEYVVLLNDDTVVTRGWLGRMIRYLQEPGVGLVGPVTNWAGNEARIDVGYDTIEGMDEFARRYASEHAGQRFDIPMLAMYCVAMRKSLLDEVGLLDEQFGIGMFEDDDFSMRVREAGYSVVCAEDIFIHHWGSASFSKLDQQSYKQLFEENRERFEAKWGRKWKPHKARAN